MKTVLIADDDKVLVKTLQAGLAKFSDKFEAIYVNDGLEAMNILNSKPIDIMVTDIQMPMMDGLVLLAFMQGSFPDIPCIIMTSHGTSELKAQLKKDVLHFIDKPVRPDELGRMILSSFEKKEGKEKQKIGIADLLSLIMMGKKTCIFKLRTQEGTTGYFYFHEGELFSAVWGKLTGEEAVLEMLGCEKAELTFTKAPQSAGKKTMEKSLSELISLAKKSNLSLKTNQLKQKKNAG
ncbi:MAG: response regulator [Deltaproteobacteria bacterium]|nr:response regulator [Deltaproteobacteria bacterium]